MSVLYVHVRCSMSMLGTRCPCWVLNVYVGVYVGVYVLAMPPSGRKHAQVQSGQSVGAEWRLCPCWVLNVCDGVYVRVYVCVVAMRLGGRKHAQVQRGCGVL